MKLEGEKGKISVRIFGHPNLMPENAVDQARGLIENFAVRRPLQNDFALKEKVLHFIFEAARQPASVVVHCDDYPFFSRKH